MSKNFKIEPTRANTGNTSGNAFRDGFRNDEEFMKWMEAQNRSLNQQINRMELQIKTRDEELEQLKNDNNKGK